jgi:DNA replication protein DnaC
VTPDPISPELKTVLRRLKLSRMLDTLPERFTLARQQKMPHQDFLLLALSDEAQRRDGQAATLRAQRPPPTRRQLERWDETTKAEFDRGLLNELASLRFLESHHHVAIVGSVGVGKTFLAHALGHVACRRGHSVMALSADQLLKTLKHARLTQTYEKEMRALLSVDLLIIDDFGLDAMDAQESRDAHEIILERHRAGSMIVTSNRGPDEWLATFADPVRAQAAIDRFTSNAYDLVIEGESYRARLKPGRKTGQAAGKKDK